MDPRRADLHTHTTCSDGVLSPAALVAQARQHGLQVLAITDHDCIDGLPEAMAAGAEHNVEILTGVELSVTVRGEEVHLLGYGFDATHPGLQTYLAGYRQHRRARAEGMVERLHGLGVRLPFERVQAEAGTGVLGRVHIAKALAAEGWTETYEAAFADYIGDGGPAFVPKVPFPSAEALALLHEAGGVGVLAHPGHWTADAVVMQLIREGMDGIEVIHPSHSAELVQYYRQLARDFVLLQTGGSDYHGFRPHDAENFGQYSIPYARVARLRKQAARYRVPAV